MHKLLRLVKYIVLLLRLVKYIVLSVVSITVLLAIGIITMNSQVKIEDRKSSYTLTKFDYLVNGASTGQLEEYLEDSDAIKGIFPVVNFEINFVGSNNLTFSMNILASDKMEQFDYGLFNDDLKLEGAFSKEGIMIDKKFQDKLNLSLGDEVSFRIMGHTITKQVSAIYRESTYKGLDGGIAVIELTDEIIKLYSKERRYDLAFIGANDITKCEALLEHYVPLRDLQDQESYIAYLKDIKAVTKTQDMTEEEYEAAYVKLYEDYYDAYTSKDYSSSVHIKNEFLEDITEQTVTLANNISFVSIVTAISSAVLFAVLFFIFLFRDNRIILRESSLGQEQTRITYKASLPAIVTGLCVGVIVAATLGIYSATKIPSPNYLKIIILFSIPSLILAAIAVPCSTMVVKKRFEKAKKAKSTTPVRNTAVIKSNEKQLEHRMDIVLFFRKWFLVIISAIIEAVVVMICLIAFSKNVVVNTQNYNRFNSVSDDVVFSVGSSGDKDSFLNYNNDNIVMITAGKMRINADVYSVVEGMPYSDNLLFYTGGLVSGECAVSQNTLNQYNLKVGDTISISGKDYQYKIKMALKPQTGVDDKYIHDGVIILAYNQSLEDEFNAYYDGQNASRVKYYMVSFDRDIMLYPTLDTTRDNSIVFAKKVKAGCTKAIVLNLLYSVLIIVASAVLLEGLLGRRTYQDLRLEHQKGCGKGRIFRESILSKLFTYVLPFAFIVLCFIVKYGSYGSSYLIPYLLLGLFIVCGIALYSYFYYRRVVRWKKITK